MRYRLKEFMQGPRFGFYTLKIQQVRGISKKLGFKEKEEVYWGNASVWMKMPDNQIANLKKVSLDTDAMLDEFKMSDVFTRAMLFDFYKKIKNGEFNSLEREVISSTN